MDWSRVKAGHIITQRAIHTYTQSETIMDYKKKIQAAPILVVDGVFILEPDHSI